MRNQAAFLDAIRENDFQYLLLDRTTVIVDATKEGTAFAILCALSYMEGTAKVGARVLAWQEPLVLGLLYALSGVVLLRQLQKVMGKKEYQLVSTKNSKGRSITVAPFVVAVLRRAKRRQLENRLRYGEYWTDSGFVFTDELGNHLKPKTVYDDFKKVVEAIGSPSTRFHDLRHSYAVASIRSGDNIKTVQENLGHATAAFTLDVYGHVTEQIKQESAARMEQFIKAVSG